MRSRWQRWQRWWDDFWYELILEIKRIIRVFMRPMTWIVIVALTAFLIELYFGMIVALRYDGLMHLFGLRTTRCRILENWQYLIIIYSLFASGVLLLYCMGNFVNWLRARARRYKEEARRLAWKTLASAIGVELIGGLTIWMLLDWC
ncbi:MAG: hypothetical protein FWH15_03205 [Betaproteobacteria bacterium]|nr:hypothetical protein [Betaproteobacteria bacterium]